MPNHITTLFTVTGPESDVAAFEARHVTTEETSRGPVEHFAFDSVVPMPQCIKDTMGRSHFDSGAPMVGDGEVNAYALALAGNRRDHIASGYMRLPAHVLTNADVIKHYDETKPAVGKWARLALQCAAETGHTGWYEWSVEYWGTKWDSYDFERRERAPGRLVFTFDTAWSTPRPIIAALGKLWPSLAIETKAVDEGGYPVVLGLVRGDLCSFVETAETEDLKREVMGSRYHDYSEDE